MPSDTPSPGPRPMPHEEFERRVLSLVNEVLAARGCLPLRDTARLHAEAVDLLGWHAGRGFVEALLNPPLVCPTCHASYRTALPSERCPDCEDRARKARERAALEAEIRAELAQKGGS